MPKSKASKPSKATKRGGNKEHENHLKRTFGDLPVRDAVDDLRIPITKPALARSKQRDPEHCMFAEACKEVLHSSAAIFFKTTAYVDVVGNDGVRRVERFSVPPQMRNLIEMFDRGEAITPDESWLVLKAPTKGETLEQKRKRHRKYEKAVLTGTYVSVGSSRKGISTPRKGPRELEVRNGRGQWQMIQGREAAAA